MPEYGRYYIQHPASANKRLSFTSGGAYSMLASSSTSGLAKWRLVRPAVSETAAMPAVVSGLTATAAPASVSLSWNASEGAATYTIERLDSAGTAWQSVATGITQTAWMQSGPASSTSYTYRVIAINIIGTAAASVSVTATTPHPLSSQAAWTTEYLSSQPLAQQASLADPDGDGVLNLLEYAYASAPTQAGASLFQMQSKAAGNVVITFPWNWRSTDITWRIRSGTDLSTRATWPVVTPQSTQTTRNGNIDQLQLTFPASDQRRFYQLEVISN